MKKVNPLSFQFTHIDLTLNRRTFGFPSSSKILTLIPKITTEPLNKYFAELDLEPSATEVEIKRAYRKLARIYHHDGTEPDDEYFKYLTHIYQTLINPQTRVRYLQTMGKYISEWELRKLREESPEVIDALVRLEQFEEDLELPVPTGGFSFWGSHEDLCQQWYWHMISALGLHNISMYVQIGVTNLNSAYLIHSMNSGKIIFWFSDVLEPNWLTAYACSTDYVRTFDL